MGVHVLRRYGKVFQLRIEREEDFLHLDTFGREWWVATAAPVESFQCDPRFLSFLDADGNGRITSEEVLAARRWLIRCLMRFQRMMRGEEALALDDVRTDTPEGQALRTAALRVLEALGKPDARELSLAEVRDRATLRMQSGPNGDGVFPPEHLSDPELRQYVQDILATVGGSDDVSGAKGVSEADVARFHEQAEQYLAWLSAPHEKPDEIFPLGDATARAYAAFSAIREKVDEFFAQCRLVQMDRQAEGYFRLPETLLKDAQTGDMRALEDLVRRAPLQAPNPDGVLYLDRPLNPAYREAIVRFCEEVIRPLISADARAISEADWMRVKERFAPYEKWISTKKGAQVEVLGKERLEQYLSGPYREAMRRLFEEDRTVAEELRHVEELEKLILYQKYFIHFLNNFVNFSGVYDPRAAPLVNAGTLVLGGQRFGLALRIRNRATHKAIASMSGMYLLYLEITGKTPDERFEVVCPVTRGNRDTLFLGKRGVFFDPTGREWDATVVDIVAQPISLKEAILAPFRRTLSFIEGKVEGLSEAREREREAQLARQVEQVVSAVPTEVPQAPPAGAQVSAPQTRPPLSQRDMLIGGSIAVAALGSAWAFISKTLAQLSPIKLGMIFLITTLAVIVPTFIVALLKLRRRNLGALFEGAAWAINMRLPVTRSLAKLLTQRPPLPPGTRKERKDMLAGYLRVPEGVWRTKEE